MKFSLQAAAAAVDKVAIVIIVKVKVKGPIFMTYIWPSITGVTPPDGDSFEKPYKSDFWPTDWQRRGCRLL
jgi:hypothetical protein